jgi:hypothetical protein
MPSYTVTLIPNLWPSPTRSLAFIECSENAEINGKAVFESLHEKEHGERQI